ncbi:MAG: response regulator transcription factor [Terrimicrobiaceae bacterium]|nr:response regulator transcription factor [Terrimicrobiaceae bacterium]
MSVPLAPLPARDPSAMTILLADHEPFFLHGLRGFLEKRGQCEIVGGALTGRQVLSLIATSCPDFLIMGFALQCGRDALGMAPDILRHNARLRILVAIPESVAMLGARLISAGVRGIFSRSSPAEMLASALQKILAGESFIDPATHAPSPSAPAGLSSLTPRELEVFRLLGQEKPCKDTAALLGISAKTVERHRENIKTKLHLRGADALRLAAKACILRESGAEDYLIS